MISDLLILYSDDEEFLNNVKELEEFLGKKTFKEWFYKTSEEPYSFDQVLYGEKKELLEFGFDWSSSEEGFKYWDNLDDKWKVYWDQGSNKC